MSVLKKELFKKPANSLEAGQGGQAQLKPPERFLVACKGCKAQLFADELAENLEVCPLCDKHLPLPARRRVELTVDEGSFEELDADFQAKDLIGFEGYEQKLEQARAQSAESEGVITGRARIGGQTCALFSMEGRFMMGSMGSVVGEKISRLFELAMAESLPVVGFCLSGGARMQEGILSLMQMAKTAGAVGRHSDAGLLFISVLLDPTAGGVTASFASLGDILLAEPGALICFAGPRVIEQTIRQTLPEGFQSAEFLLSHGFVDDIVHRKAMRQHLSDLLRFHQRRDAHAGH